MEFKSVATKRGDSGETDTFGQGRVLKDHIAVEAVGKLDMLQAEFGVALALMQSEKYEFITVYFRKLTKDVQSAIFALNGDIISLPTSQKNRDFYFDDGILKMVEDLLSEIEVKMPPIQNFCYPAGDLVACSLHKLRTVCRETEIMLVKYNKNFVLPNGAMAFINRLSDLIFVMARWVNIELGIGENLWQLK